VGSQPVRASGRRVMVGAEPVDGARGGSIWIVEEQRGRSGAPRQLPMPTVSEARWEACSPHMIREWSELATRTAASPFAEPGWFEALASAFGCGFSIVAARRNGQLVGALPIEPTWRGVRSPTNDHTPEFELVAADDEAAEALVAFVVGGASDRVVVGFLDADGPDARRWARACKDCGYTVETREIQQSPFVDICRYGGWDEYERTLSKNLRLDLRRRWRRLTEAGDVSIDIRSDTQCLDRFLREGFGIEGSDWKTAQGTAIASRRTTLAFYRQIGDWAGERGWLRLSFLRIDGKPIAFQFNVEANRVHYHLKGGYDPAYRRLSPGKMLHAELLRRAFASGLDRFDFLGGVEPYKLQFADRRRSIILLTAFSGSPLGIVSRGLTNYEGRIREVAKRNPAARRLYARVTRARARILG
jgi:CelD/BcsL family acetyltransferase involved in cellulose biosynthesis